MMKKKIIIIIHRLIGLVGRVFANGPEDLGSIPGHVIPKTLKMVLDTALLNTRQYKQYNISRVKWSNPGKEVVTSPTPTEKGAIWSPSTTVVNQPISIL